MIEVLKSADDLARQNCDVLVPTMGALHAGHESLIKLAKTKGDQVIVSIFVNPLQFENKEDLLNYPKTIDSDLKIAAGAGASAVFLPEESLIYPTGYKTIEAGGVGEIYEGKSRSGHFTGVLTVVNRLFDLVKPKYAIFGEKDSHAVYYLHQQGVTRLDVVNFIVETASSNPNAAYAGSVPYLMLAGNVISGWQLARSYAAAHQALANGDSDTAFLQAKQVTARFYADHMLSKAPAARDAIVQGAQSVTAMALDAF